MKKFDRLPLEQRKEEIRTAALRLFNQKGFAATTMENIVEQVSLSKGGVYRVYPSLAAILSDLIIRGMRLRNDYYEERVKKEIADGKKLTPAFLTGMIVDSLLLYPEISSVYVEFLWEKQRNPELEALYRKICAESVEETTVLIRRYGAEELLLPEQISLERLTELMNAAILSLRVLNLQDLFTGSRDQICEAIMHILKIQ